MRAGARRRGRIAATAPPEKSGTVRRKGRAAKNLTKRYGDKVAVK
jgi:hypothetical protein